MPINEGKKDNKQILIKLRSSKKLIEITLHETCPTEKLKNFKKCADNN